MQPGTLLAAAKRDGRGWVMGSLVLVGLCAGVLALNWKYVYNYVAGPVPFTAALAADPGPREWVRVEGPLVTTDAGEDTTLSLYRRLAEIEPDGPQYFGMLIDRKLLVVKVARDFSGQVVQGRLVPLAAFLQRTQRGSTYPWLVEATPGYRWDFNRFVFIAALLLPLLLVLLGHSVWQASHVERHPALARLKDFGPPLQVLQQVENDLTMSGDTSRVDRTWMTPRWIVVTGPRLIIVPVRDLVGLGHRVTTTKSGSEHSLAIWVRGQLVGEKVRLTEAQARETIAKASALFRWVVVPDVSEFEKAWRQDRSACERDADARRGGIVSR